MIRLVVTDLDGTFWDADRCVPAAHLGAVATLRDRGVELMVATSRRRRVVAEYLGRAGLEVPAAVIDGAMGIDLRDGSRFHESAFTVPAASAVLARFRGHGVEPCVYVDEVEFDVVLAPEPSTCPAHVERLGSVARTGDLDAVVAEPGVFGFSVVGLDRDVLEAVATDLASYGAELNLLPEPGYGGWGLFVAPPAVTKWTAVLAYCRRKGIGADEVLAVGDGDNDVAMLTGAGVAVGVRGGTERAVAAAQHLIEPPERDGWAAVPDLVDGAGPAGGAPSPGPPRVVATPD